MLKFYNSSFYNLVKLLIDEALVNNGSNATNCDFNIYAC